MKYNSKDIKKLGRAYGKRAFKLTEDDFIELSQIEQAYLAGYRKGYNEVTNIEKVCNYLRNHIDKDLTIYYNDTWLKRDEFIERLKKTMEERIMEANEVFYDVVRYWDDCDRKVLNSKPLTKQEASELYKQEFRPARYGSLYSWAIEIHK